MALQVGRLRPTGAARFKAHRVGIGRHPGRVLERDGCDELVTEVLERKGGGSTSAYPVVLMERSASAALATSSVTLLAGATATVALFAAATASQGKTAISLRYSWDYERRGGFLRRSCCGANTVIGAAAAVPVSVAAMSAACWMAAC